MNKYGVIMAGGGGTRFWPLSRRKKPKQLLNLSGKDLMVNETIDRLMYTVDCANIFIVTNTEQGESMLNATNGRISGNHVLLEPAARNTAACVGYAAMEIMRKYGDGIMVITPADAYIKDVAAFTRVLAEAVRVAESSDKLVTIGIDPTFPATGYGYIKYDKDQAEPAKTVIEFKEKPDKETAESYLASGKYAWNSGMFIWKASVILEKFKEFADDIYEDLLEIGNTMCTDLEEETLKKIYPQIRKQSIDYAIMEKAASTGTVVVIPGAFGWNDVGSWDMMNILHECDEDGNVAVGNTVILNTKNSTVYSENKLVAVVGVDNLVVVETADAVMVCAKNKAQDVKLIVDFLAESGRDDLL